MHKRAGWASLIALAGASIALFVSGTAGAQAATGDPVIAGQYIDDTHPTVIDNTNSSSISCDPQSVTTTGLLACGAWDGVEGTGTNTGISGRGDTYGVYGNGDTAGVRGDAATASANGVWGIGYTNGSGVYGETDGTGNGVLGYAPSATGVKGQTTNGTGVLATATTGTALSVNGKAKFSRSGIVTITYPAKTAVVTSVPVTAQTLAFATIQKFLAGTYVVAAVPNVGGSSNSFTIYLNKAPGSSTTPKSVTVAWYLVERP